MTKPVSDQMLYRQYKNGATLRQLERIHGIGRSTIWYRLNKMGNSPGQIRAKNPDYVRSPDCRTKHVDRDAVVVRYRAGESMTALAKVFRTSTTTIQAILEQYKVKRRTKEEARQLRTLRERREREKCRRQTASQ